VSAQYNTANPRCGYRVYTCFSIVPVFSGKFLATCTSSVPPASCLGLNKATDYAVTRPQVPPPAPKSSSPWLRSDLFLAPVGTPRTVHSHPLAIAFPVGAQQQHCCALARQAASSAAVTLLPWDCRTAFLFIDLQPLGISCLSFSRPDPLFSMICSLFCQNAGGGVPLQLLRAP